MQIPAVGICSRASVTTVILPPPVTSRIIVVMIAVPAVYSWQFYRKQKKEGTLDKNAGSLCDKG